MKHSINTSPYPKRNQYIHILFFLTIFIFLNSLTTQYIASQFNYHPNLGVSIFQNFYLPHQWFVWAFTYYDSHPTLFNHVYLGFSLSYILILGGYSISLYLLRSKRKIYANLHGSARFADKEDIIRSGLIQVNASGKGVYVGAWEDTNKDTHYLRHDGPEHILAFAPTRSGKGVGLVIPTLLSWKHSVVVLDIKGENWALTSGWRKQFANNLVLKFEP
ncbi:MAG: type IV secretory system conjugative DNA transfer family protein, partial [Candidatus Margulisbacteria bacterium]|nr:type IV secretory system conjugative DNA transfer family protein [Candidatus Margulisiibacteriota bacterium]